MKFFQTFPKLITMNAFGDAKLATNLLARTNIIPELINNPLLFYKYDTQDGDTPELIASKYYNNPYRYWMFLYGNNIMDPQWDLALSTNNFAVYLQDKYAEAAGNTSVLAYTQSTIQYYKQIVQTYDSVTDNVTINEYLVDQDTYASLPQNNVITKTFPSGAYIQVTQTKSTISIYDYELEQNEAKRQVQIIDKKYTDVMEQKLKSLLST